MFPLKDLLPTRGSAWITWTVIATCAALFVWQQTLSPAEVSSVTKAYGLVPSRFLASPLDDAETLLSSAFLHAGWLHVLGNLWYLWVFGDNVEDTLGRGRFALLLALCALGAAGAQIAVSPTSDVPMIGASGAISGVLAAYLVLFPKARVLALVPLIVFVQVMEVPAFLLLLLWFALQLFQGIQSLGGAGGGIAFFAHIGGFLVGLVAVRLMVSDRKRKGASRPR